ncbi:glutathione S-transferase N-terminal domain-containing protein [Aquincola sp. MAHUQ-54]|uniref:Glutathione S-transferase N-terminal domain-containing protein n=1 Tax=Aquincola agrisoli TaxID=3119538 RepID=A0AAW9Q9M3_9BURK
MKLYFAPGACSLASHIALHEAGIDVDRVKVDLQSKRTDDGRDFLQINPKGYVPALEIEGGEVLTENVALLDWISQRAPQLAPTSELGRTRQLELLAFISTELHKQFGRVFKPTSDAEKQQAFEKIGQRLDFLADRMAADGYLCGEDFYVADAYLYVVLRWTVSSKRPVPAALQGYLRRLEGRAAVRQALAHEMLEPVAG